LLCGVPVYGLRVDCTAYGIEASIITTIVLGVSLSVMIKIWKGRIGKNGI